MIIYVVTDTYSRYKTNPDWFTFRNNLESIAQTPCIVLHYTQISPEAVRSIQPLAICHSGSGTDFRKYDILQCGNYRRVVMECDLPQIGFCGGHQIISVFFGSKLGIMRKLRKDDPDLGDTYNPGYFKEWGIFPVNIVKKDPLFLKCGKTIMVTQRHYCEVKKLGAQLILLASSKDCRVQAFKHRSKPIYGVQFHPEISNNTYKDGTKILKNFFKLAREYRKNV